jgi:hypothetical protein
VQLGTPPTVAVSVMSEQAGLLAVLWRSRWGSAQTGVSIYLGGNCDPGTGSARLAVGALAVKPITAQLMSTLADPYGAPLSPVMRSGRVAARLNTCTSSIWRVLRPP